MNIFRRGSIAPTAGAVGYPIVGIYDQQIKVKHFFTEQISVVLTECQKMCQVTGTEVLEN